MLGYVALIVRASTLEVLQSRSPAILAGSGAKRFGIGTTIHIWLQPFDLITFVKNNFPQKMTFDSPL